MVSQRFTPLKETAMDYKQKFEKATVRLMMYHPFFSTLIVSVPYVFTYEVETAATDGSKHYFNPDFLDSLTIEEIMGLRAHEGAHDMFKHMLRMGTRIHKVWNHACDYVINYILGKSGLKLPACGLFNDELGVMTSEAAYEKLIQQEEEKRKQRGGGGKLGDGLPDNPMEDLREPSGSGDEEVEAELSRNISQRIAQAATQARLQGRMPAELELLIDKLLNPQVPWQQVLREYMTRLVRAEETWNRRNRRFKVYLPTSYSTGMGEVCVIGDTSGSMIGDTNKVATEINAINEEVKPQRVRILWADTAVHEQVFEEGEHIEFKPAGGGGTDMRVPLAYAEQFDPQVVILITDGYTPWPTQAPPYPLIVICTTKQEIPFGDVIRIN